MKTPCLDVDTRALLAHVEDHVSLVFSDGTNWCVKVAETSGSTVVERFNTAEEAIEERRNLVILLALRLLGWSDGTSLLALADVVEWREPWFEGSMSELLALVLRALRAASPAAAVCNVVH